MNINWYNFNLMYGLIWLNENWLLLVVVHWYLQTKTAVVVSEVANLRTHPLSWSEENNYMFYLAHQSIYVDESWNVNLWDGEVHVLICTFIFICSSRSNSELWFVVTKRTSFIEENLSFSANLSVQSFPLWFCILFGLWMLRQSLYAINN